jgi:hypothetical protein
LWRSGDISGGGEKPNKGLTDYGLSPIEAAATAIDIHNTASKWNKALLDNSARPSGALVYTARDGNLSPDQFDRLKSELEQGFQGAAHAGRPLLLEGGLDWKSMSLTPKDMDFIEAKHVAAREIALALGVPPMLLGIPGDNTYSNYQEATRSLWRQTVLPLATRTAKALSQWLSPAWGAPLELRPDYDAIEALSTEREALWTRVDQATFLTTNEKRAAVGYGPAEGSDPAGLSPSRHALEGGALSYKYPGQPRIAAGQREGGQYTFGPDGTRRIQGRRFFGRFPAAKPPKDGGGFGGTPKGLQFTEHGRRNATDRKFTEQRIDAIVENNAKSRVGKVDEYGKKTWEYTDARGNKVVLNEQGGIVTVYSPAPKGMYIEKP